MTIIEEKSTRSPLFNPNIIHTIQGFNNSMPSQIHFDEYNNTRNCKVMILRAITMGKTSIPSNLTENLFQLISHQLFSLHLFLIRYPSGIFRSNFKFEILLAPNNIFQWFQQANAAILVYDITS
jgi:hypothetical protein